MSKNKNKKNLDSVQEKEICPQCKLIKKVVIPLFLSLLIFIFLCSSLFFGYSWVYAQKIIPGVKVANLELDSQSKEDAQIILESRIKSLNQKAVQINTSQSVQESKLEDLGVSLNLDKTLDEVYNYGHQGNFLTRAQEQFSALFFSKEFNFTLDFDDNKLKSKLQELDANSFKEATNATFVVQDNISEVKKEEQGQTVDLVKFKKTLSQVIAKNLSGVVEVQTKKLEPTIKYTQVETIKNDFDRVIQENIVLESDSKDFTADGEEIASWLILKAISNSEVEIQINEEEIKSYLEYIAQKINKKTVDRLINAETEAVISEGQDGSVLDEEQTLEDIKNILQSRMAYSEQDEDQNTVQLVIETQERGEKRVEPEDIEQSGGTAGLSEGRYLEVNLSQQKLYAYEGTNLIGAYTVSTGKWSMPTPTGTRYIEDKTPRAWSAKYGLYMPYWNDIGGGYGIHELPEWPGGYKEGESHLGTPVSHGCIRLGVGPAEFVYNWSAIGTPVFIHK